MKVIYEDNHLIIVNKAPGEIVQGDKTGDKPLSEILKEYVKSKYNKPGEVFLGVVHRLDRPVSGVVVFARTSKALARMNSLISSREVQKTYWAIVKGSPSEPHGHLVDYLWKNETQNKSYIVPETRKGALRAELEYTLLAKGKDYSLLEVNLMTGRHHQIRVQLSAIGLIIKGDLKYGSARSNPDGSIHLHARRVEFLHPVKQTPMIVEAMPPKERMWMIFKDLWDKGSESPSKSDEKKL
jgi:23S rRNA pseudouridine1911/1915/1917 synthase